MSDATCEFAIRQAFGTHARISSYRVISDGYRNLTAAVTCDAHPEPVFFKREKPFTLPRMQKHQIPREVVALRLCAIHGIPDPRVIAANEQAESPCLLEQFIDGQLLSSFTMDAEDRHTIDLEFQAIFGRLCGIQSAAYGDTFEGGYIGQYPCWQDALSRIVHITFEDCQTVGLFGGQEAMVREALQLALSMVHDSSQAVLYHCDLFSQNIMGCADGVGKPHIRAVIDFGMSLYAPLHYVRSMTREYSGFRLPFAEDTAVAQPMYDLLRIEPLLMMYLFRYEGWEESVQRHIETCRAFLSEHSSSAHNKMVD